MGSRGGEPFEVAGAIVTTCKAGFPAPPWVPRGSVSLAPGNPIRGTRDCTIVTTWRVATVANLWPERESVTGLGSDVGVAGTQGFFFLAPIVEDPPRA